MDASTMRRALAICAWHSMALTPKWLDLLIGIGEETQLRDFWTQRATGVRLPAFEAAVDEGIRLEREYLSGGTTLVLPGDPGYPRSVMDAPRHPPVLAIRGNPELLRLPQVAIVGSRQTLDVSIPMTQLIADEVIRRGFIVTSGGALGIDGIAHRQAMARRQPTIVVSACGCDTAQPSVHADIFEYAAVHGAIVSRMPNHIAAIARNFPVRNEIIAALSRATVIVQARRKSGALYTAQAARRLGRPVFVAALQGFNELTEGGFEWVKSGQAQILSQYDDFDVLGDPGTGLQKSISFLCPGDPPCSQSETPQNDTARRILAALKDSPTTRELLRLHLASPADFDETMLELELAGKIATRGGMFHAM